MINCIVLVLEYLTLREKKGLYVNLFISIVLSFFFYIINVKTELVIEVSNNSLNLLGILLGFTISLLAIILSVENDYVNKLKIKKIILKKKIYTKDFSLFDRLISSIVMVIILLSFLLIYNFIIPIIYVKFLNSYLIYFVVNLFLIFFSILELVSCILNYYLTITSKS